MRYEYQRSNQSNIYRYSEKHLPRNVSRTEITTREVVQSSRKSNYEYYSSNTTITNERLDQLSEKIDKNTKKLIDI